MLIRPAVPTDAESIRAVHRASAEQLARSHYDAATIRAWARDRPVEEYLEAMSLERWLVAVNVRDGVVGFVSVRDSQIRALYVAPQAVRQGVGRELLRAGEQAAFPD